VASADVAQPQCDQCLVAEQLRTAGRKQADGEHDHGHQGQAEGQCHDPSAAS
jgi:hypothetical protein